MGKFRALTDGNVTGTGTVTCGQGNVAGVLLTANGTNDATVILRRDDGSGKQLFDVVSKSPGFMLAPIDTENTATVHYTISGTGAAAQIYEWVE